MGRIEQNSNLRMEIAAANNQVFIAKTQEPGSDEHAIALIRLAHLIASNTEGLTVVKELNRSKSK